MTSDDYRGTSLPTRHHIAINNTNRSRYGIHSFCCNILHLGAHAIHSDLYCFYFQVRTRNGETRARRCRENLARPAQRGSVPRPAVAPLQPRGARLLPHHLACASTPALLQTLRWHRRRRRSNMSHPHHLLRRHQQQHHKPRETISP